METKRIALNRDAYDLLKRRKRKGESFSDVVKRLAQETRPLSGFAGAWRKHLSANDIREMEEAFTRARGADRTRMAKLVRRPG